MCRFVCVGVCVQVCLLMVTEEWVMIYIFRLAISLLSLQRNYLFFFNQSINSKGNTT